tara:strand:+ start:2810 stop:3469 length:660 start_codon:yes stop_codon:yes gene_type:complete
MSQHDFNIDNQTASNTRADINDALVSLATLSSGTTAPTTTFANMLWYETDSNWLWMRNEADSAWIRFAYLNQSTSRLALQDNTNVVSTSGAQTGVLGDQSTATWQSGTGTLDSLVSPANVKSAILALAPTPQNLLGVSQTWSVVARTSGTSYRNTTGRPIQINVNGRNSGGGYIEVSTNNSSWIRIWSGSGQANTWGAAIIPDDHYYKVGPNDEVAILS